MAGINFSEALNEEQRAAVLAPDGPVLVIAAAGTGKTRTLTFRVAHLVERGVDAQRILLLTFTNRAAREMLERARGLVGEGVSGLWGGTFHHMANRMLRRHCEALGYKTDYTILDQDDARNLVRACADELDLLGKHFPKPDVLLSVYSLAANREQPVEAAAEAHFGHHPIDLKDVVKVHARYRERKRSLNAMDFDDLLVNGLLLFREHPDILARYQEHFLHILVDEYQDTNCIQAEWVDRLAARRRNLLVVGDDFQSIYSWRGADFRNILGFPKRYPDATVFKLETNYRSVPGILDVANACIAGNPEQFQKTLRAVREDGRRPVRVEMRGGEEQASYIIERAMALGREGYRMSDIAVLYRAHYHALELQLELARQHIPFDITSGVRFFEQAHIKDVCSLLRLLVNPSDELAFVRLLGMFPKTGPRTAARIWELLDHRCELKDAAVADRVRDKLPQAARASWKDIVEICRAYEKEKLSGDPGEVIYRFINAFYDEYAVETFENYDRRREDLDALIDFTTKYTSAEELLADAALMSNLDAETDEIRGTDDNVLKLSTVHQAKGLEWRVVFLIWLADGMFPSSRSINEGGEGEERRLFYVATTRARDQLYLCAPQLRRTRDGGVMLCQPSRFIEEVPSDLLEREDLGFM
ncbi:MAG: ATP-dependent DNA helicase PcrA [Verrucomicrobia bacterium ADurb.Bin345]|nr:MAG: ATP-dependent DNA helicase PcrA [Verrucomicrobia bacterium ADurb.Bin345]